MKIIREKTVCDICANEPAKIDGKTIVGPWAFMCEMCHRFYGIGTGDGKGQEIMIRTEQDVFNKVI